MGERPEDGAGGVGEWMAGWPGPAGGVLPPADERLIGLMEEFRRRERRCPDLVVRPWWTQPGEDGSTPRLGFVVEYCPSGRASVDLVVRGGRVTVDGRLGAREVPLDLADGWRFGGVETGSPETLANHLLRLADRVLAEEEAA
jgi:hypothetical protein